MHRVSISFLVLAFVTALGMIVWWLALGDSQTQAITVDACDLEPEFYDVRAIVSGGDGVVIQEQLNELASDRIRSTFWDEDGRMVMQQIRVGDSFSSRSSTRSIDHFEAHTRFNPQGTTYTRVFTGGRSSGANINRAWEPWKSEREVLDRIDPDGGFCGYSLGILTNLRQTGSHTIDGVPTAKYEATIEIDRDESTVGPADMKLEWWVDGEGRLRRRINTQILNGYRVAQYFSGFGVANQISIPGEPQATATPEPAATPTPTPTPSPPPTPLSGANGIDSPGSGASGAIARGFGEEHAAMRPSFTPVRRARSRHIRRSVSLL